LALAPACGAEILLCSASVLAQVEPIRLTYSAPPECASESQFFDEVKVRTGARPAMSDEVARAFAVAIRLDGSTVQGRLSITGRDGSSSTREVTGTACVEVVSALALMMALSIDPTAVTAPRAASAAQVPAKDSATTLGTNPAEPSPTTAPLGTPVDLNIALGRPQRMTPRSASLDTRADAHSESMERVRTQQAQWAMGGGAEAVLDLAPGMALGAEIFASVEGKASGHFVPAFRTSFMAAGASARFNEAMGADLVWLLAGFEACPFRFAWSSEVALSLCAGLEGGALHSGGASTGLQQNADVYKPWVAPAALGRFTWAWSAHWFVQGAIGFTVPLIRYQFYYQDMYGQMPVVYRVPPLGAKLGIETGYRFP
jgi:hypothetical protein